MTYGLGPFDVAHITGRVGRVRKEEVNTGLVKESFYYALREGGMLLAITNKTLVEYKLML